MDSSTSEFPPPMTPASAMASPLPSEITVMSGVSSRSWPSRVTMCSPSRAGRTTTACLPSTTGTLARSKAWSGWPVRYMT